MIKVINEGTILGNIEGLIEPSSLGIVSYIVGITESDSELIKEGTLLVLKDKIIEGDVI